MHHDVCVCVCACVCVCVCVLLKFKKKLITDNDHEAVGDIQVTNAGGSDDLLEDTSTTSSSLEVTVSQGVCGCACMHVHA